MDNHEDKSIPNGGIVDAVANKAKTKQRISWSVLACLTAILIVIILNQTGVLRNISTTSGINVQKRDLSTPSSRLVGHWKNVDGNGEVYYSIIDSSLKVGTYRLHNKPYGRLGPPIRFKILHEEPSGDKLVIREFNDYLREVGAKLGIDTGTSDITLCVPKHGQSMSQEYIFSGSNSLVIYHYIDDKTYP